MSKKIAVYSVAEIKMAVRKREIFISDYMRHQLNEAIKLGKRIRVVQYHFGLFAFELI